MREKNLNFNKTKIFKFFHDKKYAKISKISKSILKTFGNDKEIYKIIILSEINEKNLDRALIVSEKLLHLIDDAETNYIHGNILKLQNKFKEAIIFYKKAIDYRKDFFEAYNNLASSQKKIGLTDEAFENYNNSIKINDNNLEAYYNLGNLLYDEKKFDEASNCYNRVIKINENFPKSYLLLGQIKSAQGNFEEAKEYFLKAIDKDKYLSEAYVSYVNTRKIGKNDKIISKLEELINIKDLKSKCYQELFYALSKIYFDIGKIDEGFELLKKSKNIKLRSSEFTINAEKNHSIKVKEYFLNNKILKLKNIDTNLIPIFVLGMPRSGTSLIEQIISTHSKVYGAGELTFLPEIMHLSRWDKNTDSKKFLQNIRKEYLLKISKLNIKQKYIVDKNPFNFLYVGFILKAMPEAKIVHMHRNPMAVCWSNYKANFFDNVGMDYAHRLETIAEFYLIYNGIMKFWKELYPDCLINIDYDKFVINSEKNSKSLVKSIGLEWEDKISQFSENERVVVTNSLFQVRSKVYKNSSQDWLKFKKHLSPIIEILKKNKIIFS